MPLYRGGQRIAKLYRGATPIARAYKGAVKMHDEAGETFPLVISTNTSGESGNTTSHTVALPAGIVAGSRLIVFFAAGQSAAMGVTTPDGWNARLALVSNSGGETIRLAILDRIAAGEEGSTLTVATTGSATRSAHMAYQISGGGTPEVATPAQGAGTNPDPPSLSPSGGSRNYLWLAGCAYSNADASPGAVPADFANTIETGSAGGTSQGSSARMAVARRARKAASENPGAFTLSASRAWVAVTVAIGPEG